MAASGLKPLDLDFAGRVAIVTGASRGIGAAAAASLAAHGARVVLAARDGAACDRVAAAIAERGGAALAVSCDIADAAAVAALADTARRHFGSIDFLINNAAIVGPIGRIGDTDPGAWAQAIAVNAVGAFYAIRAVLPSMVAAGSGTIVNVSSGAAHRALEGWSAYCASKAALAMLTKSVAEEYGAAGIRVMGFGPGVVDTEMQALNRASGMNAVSRIPRSELAPPEYPAQGIAFLCGPGGAAWHGREVAIREPTFRVSAGLPE
jgi:NAD(P)-dependent dehydrogenase (short-subunit alcohol dehydrogenase family)